MTNSTSFFSSSLLYQVDANCHLFSPVSIKYIHTRACFDKNLRYFCTWNASMNFCKKNCHCIANKMQIKIQHFSPSNNHSACLPDFYLPQNNRFMDGMCMYYILSTAAHEPNKPFFSPHTKAPEHSVMYTEYMHTHFGEVDALR